MVTIQKINTNDRIECKAIVFDLDGTLVDSMDAFADVAERVMARFFGITPQEARRLYRQTSGLPFIQQLQAVFGNHPLNQEASDIFEKEKMAGYDSRPIFADVLRVLPLLRAQGIKLCVSSNNGEENVRQRLHEIADQFDLIVGYRPGFCKGEAHFNYICQELKIDKSDLLFVGDSLHDAKLAIEAHMPFAARLGTFTAQDFENLTLPTSILPLMKVNNFFDLMSFLQVTTDSEFSRAV